jgi:hypothetical protein
VAWSLANQPADRGRGKALLLVRVRFHAPFSSRGSTGRALLASARLPQRSASGGLAMKGWVELGGQLVA